MTCKEDFYIIGPTQKQVSIQKTKISGGELAELVSVDEKKCVGCGQCVLVCDFNALEVRYGLSKIKREDCVICGVCLDFCPMNALGWEPA